MLCYSVWSSNKGGIGETGVLEKKCFKGQF